MVSTKKCLTVSGLRRHSLSQALKRRSSALQERALEKRALNLLSRCPQVFSAGLWGFYISTKLDEKLKAEDGGYGYKEGEEKRVVADTELRKPSVWPILLQRRLQEGVLRSQHNAVPSFPVSVLGRTTLGESRLCYP